MRAKLFVLAATLFTASFLSAQKFDIDTLQYQGSDKNIINLVILADGYTKDELKYYKEDAKRFTDYFFKTEPLSQYTNYFNVFVVNSISEESGAIHPYSTKECPTEKVDWDQLPERYNKFVKKYEVPKTNPNTIFGSSFDISGIHRLVVPTKNEKVLQVLKDNIPNYSQVVILVNSPFYGGSGGEFATTTVNFKSNDIAVHEIGHSFAKLSDEYWSGPLYTVPGPNKTQNVQDVPWKNWIGTNGIGIYAYGEKDARAQWFRPHEFCKMQYLIAPFCNVCQEEFIEVIHQKTNPIISTKPAIDTLVNTENMNAFTLNLVKPIPNTLKVKWILNNKLIAENLDSIHLNRGQFNLEKNILRAEVTDTTQLVRKENHANHIYTTQWEITKPNNESLTPPILTWGEKQESCYNGHQALTVKNPEAEVEYFWYDTLNSTQPFAKGNNIISPTITENKVYYVESNWNNKKSERKAIQITVLEKINLSEKVSIKQNKKDETIILSLKNVDDKKYKFEWWDEKGNRLYNFDPKENKTIYKGSDSSTITIKNESLGSTIYLKKIDKETTCSSGKVTIKL